MRPSCRELSTNHNAPSEPATMGGGGPKGPAPSMRCPMGYSLMVPAVLTLPMRPVLSVNQSVPLGPAVMLSGVAAC
jgi:hypothetical protein